MFKRNLAVAVGIAACSAVVPSFALAQVSVGDKIRFADGPGEMPGGAFIVKDYDSSNAVLKGSFMSFCLEKNEHMSLSAGAVFNVSAISSEARGGGGVAHGSITTIAEPYPHDPLDKRTAWLYTQYMTNPGTLNSIAGWNTTFSGDAIAQGTAMQNAIWLIEQEVDHSTPFKLNGASNPAFDQLVTDLVSAAAVGSASWTATGGVRVLNLEWWSGGDSTQPQGTFAQDQLYIGAIPEPETYAMLLAGLGLMGFVARRRKKASAV